MTNLIRRIAIATVLGLAACKSNTPQSHEKDAYDYNPAATSGYHPGSFPITPTKPVMVEEDTAAIRADSIKEARLERMEFLKDSLWEHGCVPYTRLVFEGENGIVQTYDNLKRIITRGPNYIVFVTPDGRNEHTRSGSYEFIKGCEQDILGNRDDLWAGRDHK